MTKKHFEAIARILKDQRGAVSGPHAAGFDEGFQSGYLDAIQNIADELSEYFVEDNPRFDATRFLSACGVVL